jgi:hypothetical protein
MNMLKKGPEIKLRELKVPDALYDLYYDLRERHLLPLVAVLVVAIIAVPIALKQSSESKTPSETAVALAVSGAITRHPGELVVSKAAPGLRPYHRRLKYLQAKDPFVQLYPNTESSSSESSSAASGGSASETGAASTAVPPESSTGTPGTGGGATTTHVTRHVTYYSYAIDVRVVSGGGSQKGSTQSASATTRDSTASISKSKPKVEVRHNLPELTALPSSKSPAAIFMGVSKDGKKALLLLSSSVNSVFGEGLCVLGGATCQLLELEPGLPETFVYGPHNLVFKIELLKIHLIASSKPPSGASKRGH